MSNMNDRGREAQLRRLATIIRMLVECSRHGITVKQVAEEFECDTKTARRYLEVAEDTLPVYSDLVQDGLIRFRSWKMDPYWIQNFKGGRHESVRVRTDERDTAVQLPGVRASHAATA